MTDEAKISRTVVPALPGFDVAVLLSEFDGKPAEFKFNAVVAWIVTFPEDYGDGSNECAVAYPVCADWNQNGPTLKTIRQPDGSIIFIDRQTFPKGQEAEALAYAVWLEKEDHKTRQLARAAR